MGDEVQDKPDEIKEDHEELFGEEEGSGNVAAMARHMRTCKNCRPILMKRAKPIGRYMLTEFEAEVGRRATTDEKKTLAKLVLIQVSTSLAFQATLQAQVGPVIEAAERALREQSQGVPGLGIFGSTKNPTVGEA